MRPIATWRSPPPEVQAELGGGIIHARRFFLTLLVSVAVAVGLMTIGLGFGAPAVLSGFALGLLFAARVYVIAGASEWFARRRKTSPALFEMSKRLPQNDAHPVRVTIVVDGWRIGKDEGFIDFKNGMLEFNGLRTDFKLYRSSVDSPASTGLVVRSNESEPTVLYITPFDRLDPLDERSISHLFNRRMAEWMKSAGQDSEPSQVTLPPNRPAKVDDLARFNPTAFPTEIMLIPSFLQLFGLARNDRWAYLAIVVYVGLLFAAIIIGKRQRAQFGRRFGF